MTISDQTYLAWHNKLGTNLWFRRFWVFLGIYSVVFYGLALIYILTLLQDWKIVVLAAVAGLITRYGACELAHLFYKKYHPYQRLNFNPPTSWLFSFKDTRHDAFPSEHAATSAALATIIFVFFPALGLWAFAFALLVGIGRIVLGYHEPSDIVAGYLVGIISAYLLYLLSLFMLFTR